MRKAVYFFCTDYERDEVAPRVLNYLKEENIPCAYKGNDL